MSVFFILKTVTVLKTRMYEESTHCSRFMVTYVTNQLKTTEKKQLKIKERRWKQGYEINKQLSSRTCKKKLKCFLTDE